MDEEMVLLEEQLAAAHAEIEQLQSRLSQADANATTQATETTGLRRQISQAREQLMQQETSLATQVSENDTLRVSVEGVTIALRAAAGRYRDLVLATQPDLPEDLVAGDTVEDIDAAVARARQTVAQVRQHLEQQAQALRVPAGAPARGGPDPSTLTPAEKIRLGLRQT
jgi:hypothetical protein